MNIKKLLPAACALPLLAVSCSYTMLNLKPDDWQQQEPKMLIVAGKYLIDSMSKNKPDSIYFSMLASTDTSFLRQAITVLQSYTPVPIVKYRTPDEDKFMKNRAAVLLTIVFWDNYESARIPFICYDWTQGYRQVFDGDLVMRRNGGNWIIKEMVKQNDVPMD